MIGFQGLMSSGLRGSRALGQGGGLGITNCQQPQTEVLLSHAITICTKMSDDFAGVSKHQQVLPESQSPPQALGHIILGKAGRMCSQRAVALRWRSTCLLVPDRKGPNIIFTRKGTATDFDEAALVRAAIARHP